MHLKKFELPKLPSLEELQARAERELEKEGEKPRAEEELGRPPETSTPAPGITEIVCPILERNISGFALNKDKRPSARVHIMGGEKVGCEEHSIESHWFYRVRDYVKYSKCNITDRGCPYSTLPGIEEKPE